MLSFWLLLAVLNLSYTTADLPHHRILRQAGLRSCLTPNNEAGVCVDIKYCPTIFNLLYTKHADSRTTHFLRRSQCGYQNHSPQFCCVLENTETSTQTKPISDDNRKIFIGTPEQPVKQDECGISDYRDTKIIGGKNASLGDWPWMAALGFRVSSVRGNTLQFKCGGTLISDRWVVTAGHCLWNLPPQVQLEFIRLGDLDLNPDAEDGATPLNVGIERIIIHPGYSSAPVINDIALIQLQNKVQFTKLIRPLCVLSGAEFRNDAFYKKKKPFIIGWGDVEYRGIASSKLQVARIDFVDTATCSKAYSRLRTATPSVIDGKVMCAGAPGKDTCQGDSGGPLMIYHKKAYFLAGIVSFGYKCADSVPGVYTRVAEFTNWINENSGLNL